MAERLVALGHDWDKLTARPLFLEGCIHRTVTTLMMLVIATKPDTIPDSTRNQLVRRLDTWAVYKWSPESMTPFNNLTASLSTLIGVLKHKDSLASITKQRLASITKQRRHALKGIEVCAFPTCQKDTELKNCSRSAIAKYDRLII